MFYIALFLHKKIFTSIEYFHPTLRRMVKKLYISSNRTTSLEHRSFLMLVSPDFLDTGKRFQEVSACFNTFLVSPRHAIIFPSFPNLWNEEFSLQHTSKIVHSTTSGDGDLSSNNKLYLGIVWGFIELQNLQLEGQWQSKRHSKDIRSRCHNW